LINFGEATESAPKSAQYTVSDSQLSSAFLTYFSIQVLETEVFVVCDICVFNIFDLLSKLFLNKATRFEGNYVFNTNSKNVLTV